MFFPVLADEGCRVLTFSAATMPTSVEWKKFVFNGTIWVACGFSSGQKAFAYSSDGKNWTAGGTNTPTSADHTNCAWNGTTWVIPERGANTVYTSTGGINWSSSDAGVALGDNTHGTGLISVDGTFLAVRCQFDGINYFYSSVNGTSWTQRVVWTTSTGWWKGIASNGTTVVAVADTAQIVSSPVGTMLTVPWTARSGPASTWQQVIWTGRCFFAVGNPGQPGGRSYDGITWESVTLPTTYGLQSMGSTGIYGNLAVLNNRQIHLPAFYAEGPTATSVTNSSCNDGTTWVQANFPSGHYWHGSGSDGNMLVGGANDFFGGSTAGYYSS